MSTAWKEIAKETPPTQEFCYVTDGKNVAVGVWLNEFFILKGRIKAPTRWAFFAGESAPGREK